MTLSSTLRHSRSHRERAAANRLPRFIFRPIIRGPGLGAYWRDPGYCPVRASDTPVAPGPDVQTDPPAQH